VPDRHRVALVLEELLQRLRIALLLLVVARNRGLEGVPAEQKLGFLFPLRPVRRGLAERRQARARYGYENQEADVREAALFGPL
jgi:hypothetical protein